MRRRCRQPAGAWNSASGCPVAPPRQPRAIPDLIPDFRPFLMSVRAKDPVVVVGAGIVGVCCALYLLRDGRRFILIARGEPGEGKFFGNGSRSEARRVGKELVSWGRFRWWPVT